MIELKEDSIIFSINSKTKAPNIVGMPNIKENLDAYFVYDNAANNVVLLSN